MAFTDLFIRTRRSIGNVQLDAVISESHNSAIRLTNNPIEKGADITDNAVISPKEINISAEVTDTPLGAAAFTKIVDDVTNLFGTSTESNITRSNAAYNDLISLQEQREPLDIQTKLVLYENMIITNISTTKDKDNANSVFLSISAKQVNIVETEVVQLSAEQLTEETTIEQAQTPVNKGRQEPVIPTETTQTSVLKTATDFLGLTGG